MKVHLLYRDRDFDAAPSASDGADLVPDLELDTVLQGMARGDRYLYDLCRSILLTPLVDPEAILYRQDILKDCLRDPQTIRAIYVLALGVLQDRKEMWWRATSNPSLILSSSIQYITKVLDRLKDVRNIADRHAETVSSDGMATLFHTLRAELNDSYLHTIADQLKQLQFPSGVKMSATLAKDNSPMNLVLLAPETRKTPWKHWLGLGERQEYSFTVPPRDDAGSQALADLVSRATNRVANAAAQSADHIADFFGALRDELGFYVGCLNLHDALKERGAKTSFPEPRVPQQAQLACQDLRDISLVLTLDHDVIGNDACTDGRLLCIITGANSGGKSTFLRSIGQAQLMMQCGLYVTAEKFDAATCSGIFTHFIREEDRSMTSGRLDEELARFSGFVDRVRPYALVLFNESFASTNEREGSEIARQVVRALTEASIRVFFVTHLFDFAESIRQQNADGTLFLRAERESSATRNYKLMCAPPLPTSFGEDLYWKIGAWLEEDVHRVPTSG